MITHKQELVHIKMCYKLFCRFFASALSLFPLPHILFFCSSSLEADGSRQNFYSELFGVSVECVVFRFFYV